MPQSNYCYPWPASAITNADMALLHAVRETTSPRVPITRLIAEAVNATYGQALQKKANQQQITKRKAS